MADQADNPPDPPSESDQAFLKSFLEARDTPCPACGYNLRRLKGDRCPECGRQLVLSVGTADYLGNMWIALFLIHNLITGVGALYLVLGSVDNWLLSEIVRNAKRANDFYDWLGVLGWLGPLLWLFMPLILIRTRRAFCRQGLVAQRSILWISLGWLAIQGYAIVLAIN